MFINIYPLYVDETLRGRDDFGTDQRDTLHARSVFVPPFLTEAVFFDEASMPASERIRAAGR
ncbi:hypothetical protein DJ81_12950 [Halorubrum sp. Hd13]|nr:hypothetical protein DJ81_12950 [Halorubrum sp. Hd13]OYR47149.1 hypothetical protein DJ74_13420 [Halorubrum sp. Ea8]